MARTNECTTSSLEWAGLVTAIIATNVSWWLFDIPQIWNHGVSQYLKSVTWQCFRLHMPALAAIYAAALAQTPEEQAYIYYTGPFYDVLNRNAPSRGLTRFQFVKSLAMDSLSIASTIVTIHNTIRRPAGADISGFNGSLWMFPSLPVAAIGLWFLLCSKVKWHPLWTLSLGLIFVFIVGTAFAVPLALSPEGKSSKMWIGSIIFYAYMALPAAAFDFPGIILGCAVMALLARGVFGIGAGALLDSAYFPFCQLKGKPFGIAYIVVGSIGAAFAVWGRVTIYRWRDLKRRLRNERVPGLPLEEAVVRYG